MAQFSELDDYRIGDLCQSLVENDDYDTLQNLIQVNKRINVVCQHHLAELKERRRGGLIILTDSSYLHTWRFKATDSEIRFLKGEFEHYNGVMPDWHGLVYFNVYNLRNPEERKEASQKLLSWDQSMIDSLGKAELQAIIEVPFDEEKEDNGEVLPHIGATLFPMIKKILQRDFYQTRTIN